ncbi:MAG: hypothetical protein NVS3B28_23120 [Candidatus Velthaea sp.]
MHVLRRLERMPRPWFYLSAVYAAVVISIVFLVGGRAPHVDFNAFYCAGEATAHGADPYREMPLHACEYRIEAHGQLSYGETVPSPLPPYALLPFAGLSALPVDAAFRAFTALSIAALIAAIVLLRRLTGAPLLLIVAACASTAYDVLMKGQPVTFTLLGIVLSGCALRGARPGLAALAAATTMLEPHIGLPICAALFLWKPATRGVFLAVALGLAALSLLIFSPALVLAYFTTVLPLQAASETYWATQLSLTSLLVVAGVPAHAALLAGTVQYALAAAIGVFAARSIAQRTAAPEALAFIPALFSVIGGAYLHNSLLLVAVPAAVFIARRSRGTIAFVALLGLTYWLDVIDPLEWIFVVISAYTFVYVGTERVWPALLAGGITAVLCTVYVTYQPIFYAPSGHITLVASHYAQESWTEFVRLTTPDSAGQRIATLMKIPTWCGLLALAILACWLNDRRARQLSRAGNGSRRNI